MKIKLELRLQDALILNEMAKYDDVIEYSYYDTHQNVMDMINSLIDREIANFMGSERCDRPNVSGFSMSQMVSFLNANRVKQDT